MLAGIIGAATEFFCALRVPPDEDDDEERDKDGKSSDCMVRSAANLLPL